MFFLYDDFVQLIGGCVRPHPTAKFHLSCFTRRNLSLLFYRRDFLNNVWNELYALDLAFLLLMLFSCRAIIWFGGICMSIIGIETVVISMPCQFMFSVLCVQHVFFSTIKRILRKAHEARQPNEIDPIYVTLKLNVRRRDSSNQRQRHSHVGKIPKLWSMIIYQNSIIKVIERVATNKRSPNAPQNIYAVNIAYLEQKQKFRSLIRAKEWSL